MLMTKAIKTQHGLLFVNEKEGTQALMTANRNGAYTIQYNGKTYSGLWSSRPEVVRRYIPSFKGCRE